MIRHSEIKNIVTFLKQREPHFGDQVEYLFESYIECITTLRKIAKWRCEYCEEDQKARDVLKQLGEDV